MSQNALPHLLLLLSLIDLHESAAADEIFANIENKGFLSINLSRDVFDIALEELLGNGHLTADAGQTIEVEYAAYGVIQELCASVPAAELTENGRARLEEAEAYAAQIYVDDQTWAAEIEEERKAAEQKMARERLLEMEKAAAIGYPYDILMQARETKRGHSHIYVVLLDDSVRSRRRVRTGSDPNAPAIYVGMTGLAPRERFQNHKANHKAGRGYVRDHGLCLLPHLFQAYNPMPHKLAIQAEKALAEKLRLQGYTVLGGH